MTEKFDRQSHSRKREKAPEAPVAVPSRLKREEIVAKVNELAAPLCDSEGMELVFVEYQREPSGNILRIYIDKPGGVSLQDCTVISRQLSDLLDIHLDADVKYHLEVSSPGCNRPLGKFSDYIRFKGHQARIKICPSMDGQKSFTGLLSGVTQEAVTILIGDRTVEIPYSSITRARLVNYNGDI